MSDVMTVRPLLMQTDKAYRDNVSYDVTKDEILRRTSAPELFSLSNVTSYLHLARATGHVQDVLAKAGIMEDDMDRIKKNKCLMGGSPHINITEKEAEVIAAGMDQVNRDHFPMQEAAMAIAQYTKPVGPLADHVYTTRRKIGGVLCSKQGNQFNMIGLRL